MDPFITVTEVQARLDFVMDARELAVAEAAIEDASDLAREYGRDWASATVAPRTVLVLVRRAVVRHIKNINGYTTSRAGDETLQWSDEAGEHMADLYFTEDEQQMLARLAGRSGGGFTSVGGYAWSSRPSLNVTGYVSTSPGGDPFPYYASTEHPW